MTRQLRTCIVLASGARAKWIERDGDRFAVQDEMEAPESQAGHHTATVHHGADPSRHGAGEADLAEQRRRAFAIVIAERLNAQAAKDAYARLALVAPPELLNAIRDHLSHEARSRLVHELPKDLTKTPLADLGRWLNSPLFG